MTAPTDNSPPPRLATVVLAFTTVYLVWGSTYLAIRFAVETLPPLLMAGVRFVVAGAILFPIVRSRAVESITLRQWRNATIVGGLMLLGGNGLVCLAELRVPSGIAALMVATVPLWMIGLDWTLFRGPRPTRLVLIGLAVGLVGIWLLVDPTRAAGDALHLPSAIALLAACAFWSLGSLYSRRSDLPKNAFLSTAMQMLAGGVVLLLAGTLAGEWPTVHPAAMSLKSLLALAYLIVFGALLALSAYVWLLKNCTAAQVSTYAFVNPVIAVVLGVIFANEPFNARTAIAALVILTAVVMITVTGKRRATTR